MEDGQSQKLSLTRLSPLSASNKTPSVKAVRIDMMRRRTTGQASQHSSPEKVGRSLRRRVTQPFSQQAEQQAVGPALYQFRYSIYNGLTWETLRGYLTSKFPSSNYPGLQFNEVRVRMASFLWLNPETCC
jgi:hypothetical protein